jgi:L-ascorbate metabolism protein UlaG (beta-lactamase superfamily)
MRITKYVHSCLLVETDERTALFDPGQFSWESGLFDVDLLERLDEIVISHEHFDHCHLPFIEALAAKFPKLCLISTPPVIQKLQEAGLTQGLCVSNERIVCFSTAPHAPLEPMGHTPEHVAVHYQDRLTFCGDRHDIEATKDILALPVTAPWGAMLEAVKAGLRLRPKTIIPIHDWHWNDQALAGAYDTLERLFGEHGITFIKPENGKPFTV